MSEIASGNRKLGIVAAVALCALALTYASSRSLYQHVTREALFAEQPRSSPTPPVASFDANLHEDLSSQASSIESSVPEKPGALLNPTQMPSSSFQGNAGILLNATTSSPLGFRSAWSSAYSPPPPCAGPCGMCLSRVDVAVAAEVEGQTCRAMNNTAPCMQWLVVRSGLGNRLRAMVSYLAVARFMGCHLSVLWSHIGVKESDEELPSFGDLFETPAAPDFHVLSLGDPALRQMPPRRVPATFHIHPQSRAIFPLLGPLALRVLRPLPAILGRIEVLLAQLGPSFTSLHIRRTDKNSDYSRDALLAGWTRRYPDSKVFVAADNALSLANVRGALPAGAVVAQDSFIKVFTRAEKRKSKTSARHTTLADAIVDMWTASFAAHFRGTLDSSYSVLIQQLRTGRDPTGEVGIDAWVSNCADTPDYPRITPDPPWMRDAAAWPSALTFTNVTALYKAHDGKCRHYEKSGIKQLHN